MMKRFLYVLLAGAVGSGAMAYAQSTPPVEVSITRLDCGTVQVNDLNQFSDTQAYTGKSKRLTDSCYLIRHGSDVMLWDTGLPAAMKGKAIDTKVPMDATVTRTLDEQFAALKLTPADVKFVGISHYHFDHIGQLAELTNAKLFIGAGDWAAVSADKPAEGIDGTPFKHWIGNRGAYEAVTGDKDIFGDGTVTMLDMPGHTPGHHSLLVRLKGRGNILLTGDLTHFTENYATNGVPTFNTNRADTLASLDRFKAMAKNLRATVIIQHEPADIAKLPAFPEAAR